MIYFENDNNFINTVVTPVSAMIHIINSLTDPIANYLRDDPIRPHIPPEIKIGKNKKVLALVDDDKVSAMVCAKFCRGIPSSEQELLNDDNSEPDTVVFYTIWSYSPGSGQKLLRDGLEVFKKELPNIVRFVTLSPQTEMAKRFHLKNGANIFRINSDTINYEYII